MARKNCMDFKPSWRWLIKNLDCFLAFGFGSGLSRIMPGTAGTVVALPLAWLWLFLGFPIWSLAVISIPLFIIGVWLCQRAEIKLGVADYGGIVWDEITAMILVLSVVPFSWAWWLVAFILFRFFDMVKPFPIKWLDSHVHGGFGIMIDDILAGFMAMLILILIENVLPWL